MVNDTHTRQQKTKFTMQPTHIHTQYLVSKYLQALRNKRNTPSHTLAYCVKYFQTTHWRLFKILPIHIIYLPCAIVFISIPEMVEDCFVIWNILAFVYGLWQQIITAIPNNNDNNNNQIIVTMTMIIMLWTQAAAAMAVIVMVVAATSTLQPSRPSKVCIQMHPIFSVPGALHI